MSVKVIVEFTAKPGQRDALISWMEALLADAPPMPGSLGASFYKSADDPDVVVEIADWESSEARMAVFEPIIASGALEPMHEFLAEPMRTTILEA